MDAKLPREDETGVPWLLAKVVDIGFVAELPLSCDVERSNEEYSVVLSVALSLPGASDLELVNNTEPPESVAWSPPLLPVTSTELSVGTRVPIFALRELGPGDNV